MEGLGFLRRPVRRWLHRDHQRHYQVLLVSEWLMMFCVGYTVTSLTLTFVTLIYSELFR